MYRFKCTQPEIKDQECSTHWIATWLLKPHQQRCFSLWKRKLIAWLMVSLLFLHCKMLFRVFCSYVIYESAKVLGPQFSSWVILFSFPFLKNGFLTATLLLKPFLMRVQWTVDESTEQPDAVLWSCVRFLLHFSYFFRTWLSFLKTWFPLLPRASALQPSHMCLICL